MPRTVDEGFRDFLKKLTPSGTETDAAKKHRASIEACLKLRHARGITILCSPRLTDRPTAGRGDLARATHCAKFRLIEVSIGTYSFPYWHAFGVDDAAISHKQSLARANWCSRCGSLFLSTNGSFFVIAEGLKSLNRLRRPL